MAFINLLTGEAHGRTGNLVNRSYRGIHITQIRPLKKRHPSAQERQRAGAFFNTVRILAELRNKHGFHAQNLRRGDRELNFLTSQYKTAYLSGSFIPAELEKGIFFQAIAQSANAYFSQAGQKLTIIQNFATANSIDNIQRIDVLILDDWLRVKQRYLVLPPYDSENIFLLNVAEKPEKVLIIYNYTDPQAGLCKGILFTSGEVMEIGQTPIGLISMYFGATPANCISLLCPKNTFFNWVDYPLLNCLEFKRQLDPFIAAGKCNGYTDLGFYAPDVRGLFAGFAGQNSDYLATSGQNPRNAQIGDTLTDLTARHNHAASQPSHKHVLSGFSSSLDNASPNRIRMQPDGNFVIYNSQGAVKFNGQTTDSSPARYKTLSLGEDGESLAAQPSITVGVVGDYTRPCHVGINLIVRYK